jgi:hypothetical protein
MSSIGKPVRGAVGTGAGSVLEVVTGEVVGGVVGDVESGTVDATSVAATATDVEESSPPPHELTTSAAPATRIARRATSELLQ